MFRTALLAATAAVAFSISPTLAEPIVMSDAQLDQVVAGAPPDHAGAFGRDIGVQINQSDFVNDEQKEQLRKQLFIFEEFYKSASSIQSKITGIIEKTATGIRG